MLKDISWLGQAGFRIKIKDVLIYIDPYKMRGVQPAADIILITHPHLDHCSVSDIEKIRRKDTAIIAPADCAKTLANITQAVLNEKIVVKGVRIKVMPAYNIAKHFHQKASRWVGYIIDTPSGSIYHTGDSDKIPEMDTIKADILLLPVGGTYTMDAKEAFSVAMNIRPRIVIPMHYGSLVGSPEDAVELKSLCEKNGIECKILTKD